MNNYIEIMTFKKQIILNITLTLSSALTAYTDADLYCASLS